MKIAFPLSVTWRMRLLNGLLSASVLVVLILLAQARLQSVLYASIDRALRDQASDMVRDDFHLGPAPPDDARKNQHPRREPPPIRFGTLSLCPPRHISLNPGKKDPHGQPPWSQGGFDAARTKGSDERDELTADGTPLRVYSLRVTGHHGNEGPAILQTAATLSEAQAVLHEIETALYAILLPLALATGLLGAILTDIALAPVRRLTQAIAALDANNLTARLPAPGGNDTIDRLVTMLNALLGRLDAAFATQKRFTADASHELRTPLAVVKAATSLLLETPESLSGMQRRALEGADQATDRATRLVADLLLLARTENGTLPVRLAELDLGRALTRAVQEVETATPAPHAPVGLELAEGTVAHTDPDHLHRLVVNLLSNALRHTPTTGTVTIAAHRAGSALELQLIDTGEGIAPDALSRLGEAFYRPDASRARAQGGRVWGWRFARGSQRLWAVRWRLRVHWGMARR